MLTLLLASVLSLAAPTNCAAASALTAPNGLPCPPGVVPTNATHTIVEPQTLPFTGDDELGWALIGSGTTLFGYALLGLVKRR